MHRGREENPLQYNGILQCDKAKKLKEATGKEYCEPPKKGRMTLHDREKDNLQEKCPGCKNSDPEKKKVGNFF